MKKKFIKVAKDDEIEDLCLMSNSVFLIEVFYENELVDRQYIYPGSRIYFINLFNGEKIII